MKLQNNKPRMLYLPQIRGHKQNFSRHQKEKCYTGARQVVEKATDCSLTHSAISETATLMDLSSEELMTNYENWSGKVKNYIRKRTQERNGRRRKANGRFRSQIMDDLSERDEDVLRYQGQAFSYIGVDELTQYATPFSWQYLRSRLRTTDPNCSISKGNE